MELNKLLEKRLDKLVSKLKPELQDSIVILSTRESSERDKYLAICDKSKVPNVITLYLGTFNKIINKNIEEMLKKVISHEIIHSLQDKSQVFKEPDAYRKQSKMNFFND
jgi:hypothetical protein